MRILRVFPLLPVFCLATGTFWGANDPFLGKWRVNPSKCKLTDEMKVEALGANKYAFTFGPGAVDTIVADGTDQPALTGTTLAVKMQTPNTWTVIRKKGDRTLLIAHWTLSADGKTLSDAYTGYAADGSTLKINYVYQRAEAGSGFAGTWDSVSAQIDSPVELQIQQYEGDGLSFSSASMGMAYKMKFDGNDYPYAGTDPARFASSGRRINERHLEIKVKYQRDAIGVWQVELSRDRKTLTMSLLQRGESEPKNTYAFDRE